MDIQIFHGIEGAKQARGLAVVIDVFRAFSVACYAYAAGAEKIIPVADLDLAYALKKQYPEYVLIGERHAKKPEGFDYGNSPVDIERVSFDKKTIIHTTSAGTQGIINASGADEIITGAFVNIGAVIRYIKLYSPQTLSLICTGLYGVQPDEEDDFCAQYIKNSLEGKTNDFAAIVSHLRHSKAGLDFYDETKTWKPERDFDLCLSLNKFNFVLKAERDAADMIYFKKIYL
ncbi:MAG: 2-phosphosulfolactate phosphatase [Candidatus Woesearchaeota archaeon]